MLNGPNLPDLSDIKMTHRENRSSSSLDSKSISSPRSEQLPKRSKIAAHYNISPWLTQKSTMEFIML